MNKLFGERIHQFVLSCDIMDEELFHDILELIDVYLKDELRIERFSVLVPGKVDRRQGLRTIWSTSDDTPAYSIQCEQSEEGESCKCTSFKGFVHHQDRPLWLVDVSASPNSEVLYKDYWSKENTQDGPLWREIKPDEFLSAKGWGGENRPKTLVLHPLTVDNQPAGVMELTLSEPLIPTATTRREIKQLATVVSRTYQMFAVRKRYRTDTKNAIRMLENARKEESWSHLGRPKLFVAFSGGTGAGESLYKDHEAIVASIKEILDTFNNAFEITYWDEMEKPGNITSQLIDIIISSDYGIAYFSEPSKDGNGEFQDNPNVLFEAGMMQALANTPGVRFKSWIPVRVQDDVNDAAAIPFDIASERIVLVQRTDKSGAFNKEKFNDDLGNVIQSLLDDEE